MKKIMMTLAAVLCCAMTTTVFTACGDDDDDSKPDTTDNTSATTPVYAYVNFKFDNTADMLKYLNIEIVYQVNEEQPQTFGPLTDKDVNSENVFGLESAPKIPVKLTFYRKVTVKDEYKESFASLEKFDYTNKVIHSYGLYNADRKLVPGIYIGDTPGIHGEAPGEKMLQNMEKGIFDNVYTVTFDEKGNKTFTNKNPKD